MCNLVKSSSLRLAACFFLVTLLHSAQPAQGQELDKLLEVFQWRAIGPTVTSGRIVDIDVDPNDYSTIYAASASGGLWKTTNNGTTWSCIFENEGTISIGDICVDPNDSNVIWVGTGEANNQRSSFWGDGIYKSTDAGKTWTNVGLAETHHIGRVLVDPADSNVVYVAAMGYLYSANEERGLFKTSDGGQTWEKVLYLSPQVGIVDVVLDPKDSKTLYAASYERLRRAWDLDESGPGSAIYKSTDAGATWRRLEGGLPQGEIGRIGVCISANNPGILYATVSNMNLQDVSPDDTRWGQEDDNGEISTPFGFTLKYEDDQCLIASTTGTGARGRGGRGGRGFQQAPAPDIRRGDLVTQVAGKSTADKEAVKATLAGLKPGDRIQLTVVRGERTQTASFSVPNPPPRQVGGEVYRTEDAGETWTKTNTEPVGGSPPYYYGQIRIDPQDDQRIYVLSIPLYASGDGGKAWNRIAGSVHVDHHALWINPHNPRHMLLGNDGGFHASYDRGETWDWLPNLPLSQFYAIGVDMQVPYHVYGGMQDNGSYGGPSRTRFSRGSMLTEWYRVGGGDGFYVQVDPTDSNILYSESQFGSIVRVDRSRNETRNIRPPQSDPQGDADRYNWCSPMLLSQHDPRVIYFCGNKVFKSYNRGDDWLVISPDLTTRNLSKINGNVPHCTITTIDESPLDRNLLIAGTDDGNVQITSDGGKNWNNLSDRFPFRPDNWWCTRVFLSPHDRLTAYVSFSGYREDDFRPFVFKTTDGGQSWQSIAGNLPDEPVNVIKADPKNKNVLYVGTDFGVFVSIDDGANWIPLRNQLPRVAVHDLVLHPRDNDLVAGTHGRGIFILDDVSAVQQISAEVMEQSAALFRPRPEVLLRRTGAEGVSGDRKVYFDNPINGVALSYYLKEDAGETPVTLKIFNETGDEMATIPTRKSAGLHRAVWSFAPTGGGRGFGGRGVQRPAGPPVTPGTYQAVLSVGADEHKVLVKVLADEP